MQILITFSVIYKRANITRITKEITSITHNPLALLKVLTCPFAYYVTKPGIILLYNINLS